MRVHMGYKMNSLLSLKTDSVPTTMSLLSQIPLLCLLLVLQETCGNVQSPLNGKHLKVIMVEQTSALWYIRDSHGRPIGVDGPIAEFSQWLAKSANFTFEILYQENNNFGTFSNGTFTGALGKVYRKEADFLFSLVGMGRVSGEIFDFSHPLHEDESIFLLPLPKEESRVAAPVKPYSSPVWCCIGAGIFSVTFFAYFAAVVLRKIQNREADVKPIHVFLYTICLLLAQGGNLEGAMKKIPARLILASWCLATLVLVNIYNSSFISYATVPKYIRAAETLEDAAYKSHLEVIAHRNDILTLYMDAKSGPYQQFGVMLRAHPENILATRQEIVEKVASGCCFFHNGRVMIETYIYLDLNATGKCRCSLSSKTVHIALLSFVAPKGSGYTNSLRKQIMIGKEVGLTEYWKKKYNKRPFKCLNLDKETPPLRALTLTDLAGPFLLLGIGITASTAAFLVEMLARKVERR